MPTYSIPGCTCCGGTGQQCCDGLGACPQCEYPYPNIVYATLLNISDPAWAAVLEGFTFPMCSRFGGNPLGFATPVCCPQGELSPLRLPTTCIYDNRNDPENFQCFNQFSFASKDVVYGDTSACVLNNGNLFWGGTLILNIAMLCIEYQFSTQESCDALGQLCQVISCFDGYSRAAFASRGVVTQCGEYPVFHMDFSLSPDWSTIYRTRPNKFECDMAITQ